MWKGTLIQIRYYLALLFNFIGKFSSLRAKSTRRSKKQTKLVTQTKLPINVKQCFCQWKTFSFVGLSNLYSSVTAPLYVGTSMHCQYIHIKAKSYPDMTQNIHIYISVWIARWGYSVFQIFLFSFYKKMD